MELDEEELKKTRERNGIVKCKDCVGCNLINSFGFKGREECKYFIKKKRINWFMIFVAILELSIIGFGIYGFYLFLSMKVGG